MQRRGDRAAAACISTEEVLRRRRRRLAGKAPETRRRRLQYHRRHNEKDGRLFYCDYCDLFVSSAQRSWKQHLNGVRHMEAMEAYYALVETRDPEWLNTIGESVARAHMEEHIRQHQRVAGKGATLPIPAMTAGFVGHQGITVGGVLQQPQSCSAGNVGSVGGGGSNVCGTPSVRVAGLLVCTATPPVVKVGNKTILPPSTVTTAPR